MGPEKRKRGRPKQDPTTRRNQILGEAAKAFSRDGFARTDLQQVADLLGIAKGTIYLYFASKEELFLAAVDHAVERLTSHITTAVETAEGPVGQIEALVRAHLEFVEEDLAFARIIAAEGGEFRDRAEQTYLATASEKIPLIAETIRAGQADGVFRAGDPTDSARVLTSLLHGTMVTHILSQRFPDVKNSIESVTSFVLGALRK